jgi:hypothetical protein
MVDATVTIYLGLSILVGIIAVCKGRSFFGGFMLSLLLSPLIMLPIAIFMRKRQQVVVVEAAAVEDNTALMVAEAQLAAANAQLAAAKAQAQVMKGHIPAYTRLPWYCNQTYLMFIMLTAITFVIVVGILLS